MTRYFVLLLSLILILSVFSGSCYQYDTASIYAEALIDKDELSIQKGNLSGDNISLTTGTPTPSPMLKDTPTPKVIETPPVDNPVESVPPTSTPEPQVQIYDLPDWYKSIEKGIKVPILMYHNLLEGSAAGDGLNVSEAAFEDQMYHLKAHGYNTITFNDLYDHYMNESPLPENPVIITFDDGYESNYTIGYPILKKYSFNACIFIITNAIGNNGYLGEAQLKEITSSGVIDIQNHSASHSYDLPVMSESKIGSELSESKIRLESITGIAVNIFCFPCGRYSQSLVDELIEQGYFFSVTTKYGIATKKANPFLLPRIRVMGSDSGKDLRAKIEKLTGRVTEFIGIPEETLLTEPSLEPAIEPDQSTDSNPDTNSDQSNFDESIEPEPDPAPEENPPTNP